MQMKITEAVKLRRKSLTVKLILWIGIIIALLSAGMLLVVRHILSKMMDEQITMRILAQSRTQGLSVANTMKKSADYANALAGAISGYDSLPDEYHRGFADTVVHSFVEKNDVDVAWAAWPPRTIDSDDGDEYFYTCWSRNDDGSVVEDSVEGLDEDWYAQALASSGTYFDDPDLDTIDGENVIVSSVYKSISDRGGKNVGVVGIDVDLSRLSDMFSGMKIFGDSGYTRLLDHKKKVIVSEEKSLLGQTSKESMSRDLVYLFNNAAKSREVQSIRSKGYFYVIVPVQVDYSDNVWFFLSATPLSVIKKSSATVIMLFLLLIVILSLSILIAINVIVLHFLKPLNSIIVFVKEFIASIESGSSDYSQRIKVKSDDEVGQLAISINAFISKLGVVMGQIRDSQDKEHRMGEQLFKEAQNLVVSTKETAATSQDSSAAVKEIVATMEDSNVLSENISTKIKDVTSVASMTSSDVADGVAKIEENVARLHEIYDANQQTIDGIKNLSEKIESIWDIVTLINNVADQAKIIAFNAELEASTAGEAGKSFRIVANEIRRLSDGIIDGTKEIKERINEIQHSSDTLILASESGTEKINAGYENARGLGEKFESIKNSAEITSRSADDIASIIQQQATASEQILIALKEISSGVESFTVASENISDAAETVRKISEDLNNASRDDE